MIKCRFCNVFGLRSLRRDDLFALLAVAALFYLKQMLSFRFGINFEEGRDGNAYYLAIQGYKPYLDFEWVYGPLSFLIYPPIMKAFGVNLIVMRLAYIFFASLVIPLSYFLARKIMPVFQSAAACFLAVNLFDVPYYTYNHVFIVLGELCCLLMLVRAINTEKYSSSFVAAGLFATVAVLAKPFASGLLLAVAVFLFLIVLKIYKRSSMNFTRSAAIFFVTVFLSLAVFSRFYLGGATVRAFFLTSTPFSPDPAGSLFDVMPNSSVPWDVMTRFFMRSSNAFDAGKIFLAVSSGCPNTALVKWFDDFIFILPYLLPVLILILYYLSLRAGSRSAGLIRNHKPTLTLLVLFSMVISVENLVVAHRMSRAFNVQTTFILLIFFLYALTLAVPRHAKTVVSVLCVFFVVSLSYLHFLRYPISRSREFRVPLELERARGVLVTPEDKDFFETLALNLSANLKEKDSMAVLAYMPQLSFLTGRPNIFGKEPGIFLKLDYLRGLSKKDKVYSDRYALLESRIIRIIAAEKPKIILDVVFIGTAPLYKNTIGEYITGHYILGKSLGPVAMEAIKGGGRASSNRGRLDLYLLK